jgi:hypothetical protein
MQCGLLIGTKLKQVYIDGFLQGTNKDYVQYTEEGQLVNGLPYIIQSGIQGAHRKYMQFQTNPNQENNQIKKLFDGSLGQGFMYYADPYAHNILPLSWSVPSNQDRNGVGFDSFQSAEPVTTPSNTIGLPAEGAVITVPEDGLTIPFTFLVPDDNDLCIGIKGAPGTISAFTLTWGQYTISVPISSNLTNAYDMVLSRDTYPNAGRVATLTIKGTGKCTLYGLQLSYTNRHATMYSVNQKLTNEFYSGEGMCGGTVINDVSFAQFESNKYSNHQQMDEITFVANEWSNN